MKQFKKQKSNILIIISFIILIVFSISITFAYWINIVGAEKSTDESISIGQWGIKMFVMKNQSYIDEPYQVITLPRGSALGLEAYQDSNNFPINPRPYSHPDILENEYIFEGWYKSDGTILDPYEILDEDIYVYPSWKSNTLFEYSLGSNGSTIKKNLNTTYSGNLYIPGWRYRGMRINQMNNFNNIDINRLTIGFGIKDIISNSLINSSVNSLFFEEGLENIQHSVFKNLGLTGSLTFPSTIKTIGSNNFIGNPGLNGTLDLSLATNLTTIGQSAFEGTNFTGDLVIGPAVKSIAPSAFKDTAFDGTLDLNNAVSLEKIEQNAFYNASFEGPLYLPFNLKSIASGAFQNNNFKSTLNALEAYNLESIGSYAFRGSSFIGDLDFSNTNLHTIGQSAFQASGFTGEFKISSSITTLQTFVFAQTGFKGDLDLSSATNLEVISTSLFDGASFDGKLTLPSSITRINQKAFDNIKFSGTLDLVDLVNLTYIGTNAFSATNFDGSLVIPVKVEEIAANAFKNTKIEILDLRLAKNLAVINSYAFQNSNLSQILFNYNDQNLKQLGTSAFQANKLTGYIIFPEGLEYISSGLLNNNNGITGVYIPASVFYLGEKIIGNKTPFTFDIEALQAGINWHSNWYYPGNQTAAGQTVNFGVLPPPTN